MHPEQPMAGIRLLPDPYPNGTWVEITCDDNDIDAPHVGAIGRIVEYTQDMYQIHLCNGPVVYLPQCRAVAITAAAINDHD